MFPLLLCFIYLIPGCFSYWTFYITEKNYTWQEAVDNPPCHIVGMTKESRDRYTNDDDLQQSVRVFYYCMGHNILTNLLVVSGPHTSDFE